MFLNTYNRGFQLFFPNRHGISVQWGAGNYCSRHNDPSTDYSDERAIVKSEDAEITIVCGDAVSGWEFCGRHTHPDIFADDNVKGYVDAQTVARLIFEVSQLPFVSETEAAFKYARKPYSWEQEKDDVPNHG